MKRVVVLLIMLALSTRAYALEQPIVRVSITPDSVTVGQPATLRVEVLVPTWFTRPLVYPSFEIANAITRQPPDSSFPISERIDGSTWSGISRKYVIYPLQGANYTISGESIGVSYANPGAESQVTGVDVPDIVLRGRVPTGAESLSPYLAGSRLTLTIDIDGDSSELATGDALVVHYSAELVGLPAIFIPPLAPEISAPGLAVYADEPTLTSVTSSDIARRSERITLVFEAGGEFTIPGISLDYYNLDAQRIETVATSEVFVQVAGAPFNEIGSAPSSSSIQWQHGVMALAALLLLALLGFSQSYRHSLWNTAIHRYQNSELVAFLRLRRTLRSRQLHQVYPALQNWLSRLAPRLTLRELLTRYGSPEVSKEFDALSQALYGSSLATVNGHTLWRGLRQSRKHYKAALKRRGDPTTGRLNP